MNNLDHLDMDEDGGNWEAAFSGPSCLVGAIGGLAMSLVIVLAAMIFSPW